jgi:uncharacterized membrane protein
MKSYIKYPLFFILFSFIGLIIENIFFFIIGDAPRFYDKSIFLFLGIKIPFILIYGFVGCVLLKVQSIKINFIIRGILNGIIIILSEFIIGLISLQFNYRAWDYSNHFMNLLGIISLQMSIIWIILGIVFSFIYKLIMERK